MVKQSPHRQQILVNQRESSPYDIFSTVEIALPKEIEDVKSSLASAACNDYNAFIAFNPQRDHMATLTIRNIDDDLKSSLRVQAARHGQSMEEELRNILREALARPSSSTGLGQRLVERFKTFTIDLPMPPRSLPRTPPNWEDLA